MPIKRLLLSVDRQLILQRTTKATVLNRARTSVAQNSFTLQGSFHYSVFTTTCFSSSYHQHTDLRWVHSNAVLSNTTNEDELSKDKSIKNGDDVYNLAMDTLQKAEKAKKLNEEKLLREQYDAMNKQRQRSLQREKKGELNPKLARINSTENSRDRAAGVAVIRTIVKQSQRKEIQIDQHRIDNRDHDELFWENKARELMEEAAFKYGHPSALVRLGNDALESSESDDDDLQRLMQLALNVQNDVYRDQTDTNHYNEYLSPSQQLAACLYKAAGRRGSAEGLFNLGHLLWEIGENESIKDDAFQAFYNSFVLGDVDAMYFLAVQYLSHDEEDTSEASTKFTSLLGRFFDRIDQTLSGSLDTNQDLAMLNFGPLVLEDHLHQLGYNMLHEAALRHNHGPALYHLAILHQQVNQNDDEFKSILMLAAATGHSDSLFLQGHCYYHGSDGYELDLKEALDNFLAAAENSHIDAMISAGAMLHGGVQNKDGEYIIQQDMPRAFDLYQQAGELGSLDGWRNIVHCYATGKGVPKCLDTAKHIAETMLKEE
jgi:TPR repeat protein